MAIFVLEVENHITQCSPLIKGINGLQCSVKFLSTLSKPRFDIWPNFISASSSVFA